MPVSVELGHISAEFIADWADQLRALFPPTKGGDCQNQVEWAVQLLRENGIDLEMLRESTDPNYPNLIATPILSDESYGDLLEDVRAVGLPFVSRADTNGLIGVNVCLPIWSAWICKIKAKGKKKVIIIIHPERRYVRG